MQVLWGKSWVLILAPLSHLSFWGEEGSNFLEISLICYKVWPFGAGDVV